MRGSLPTTDPIKKYQRQATARRRVGLNSLCACGEIRVEALIGNSGICVECKRKMRGHTVMDNHHVAGKANSVATVAVPANDHRAILSEAQYDWPRVTLENPEGCPLLAAAGCIRGFIDTVLYLIDQLLRGIADMLEALSAFLVERLGPRWWVNTSVDRFSRKG